MASKRRRAGSESESKAVEDAAPAAPVAAPVAAPRGGAGGDHPSGLAPSAVRGAAVSGDLGAAVESTVDDEEAVALPASLEPVEVRGDNKSARSWREPQTARTSLTNKTKRAPKGSKVAWNAQQARRAAREAGRRVEKELKEAEAEKRRLERERREAKRKRAEENEAKSTVFQVLRNPEKIKKMTKNQVKLIRKVRINARGVKEFVSPWAK